MVQLPHHGGNIGLKKAATNDVKTNAQIKIVHGVHAHQDASNAHKDGSP